MFRLHYLLGTVFIALCGLAVARSSIVVVPHGASGPAESLPSGGDAAQWFATLKPFCNALEVDTRMSGNPPPAGLEGQGYGAACYALAGKIDRARELILTVEPDQRWRAAGIVFEIGHPIADAGDDRSAGPIMSLVVEFWPNHYMALYHAGAAAYGLGQADAAGRHLRSFLRHYTVADGWGQRAQEMLRQLESR
jgi:hypothetical protein